MMMLCGRRKIKSIFQIPNAITETVDHGFPILKLEIYPYRSQNVALKVLLVAVEIASTPTTTIILKE